MSRIILIIFLWIGASSVSISQSDELLDSLQTQFELAESDTMHCYWLYQQAWVNFRDNSTLAEEYTNQAIAIAENMPDSGNIIKGLYYKGLINRLRGRYDTSLVFLGMALEYYERNSSDMHATGPLFDIAVVHSYLGNYETSIQYYIRELKINEENGRESSVANSLNSIGIINRKLRPIDGCL